MAFNVNFSPIGTLVSLASAAGQAQAAQRTQTLLAAQYQHQDDLRLRTQQLQQAAQQNNQEFQLRDRAMQLQEAAADRIADTPTSYQQMKDRLSLELQGRKEMYGEAQQAKADQQAQELQALEALRSAGGVDDQEYARTRFGIMTNTTGVALQKAVVSDEAKAASLATQRQQAIERGNAADLVENISQEMNRTDIPQERRAFLAKKMYQVVGQATQQWGETWKQQPMERTFAKTAIPKGGASGQAGYPLPPDRSQWVAGRLYYYPEGSIDKQGNDRSGQVIGTWTGREFRWIDRQPPKE
ncbi:MAG: hypothetical protein NTW96_27500 [Planctomycetia bacterium]|nr:hypothetical protein [Planctomycetia bacterium]